MANPIRRLVQLVLDRNAANKTRDDATKALGGVDKAMEKLRGAALKLGAAIGAAFSVAKIIEFGRAAVREAAQGQKEWSALESTITAAGGAFDEMRDSLDAASVAFQDATEFGAGDYLDTLNQMISISGDVAASTANMGLVANVAAQFFDGDLTKAAERVARAMNGDVSSLRQIGIVAGSAQEALEILASRSMGAAEERARTFNGQLSSLRERFNDFLDSVGVAIIGAEGAGEAFNVLRAIIGTLTNWVKANSAQLSGWVTGGIRFAIDATDVLYRAILGLSQLIGGGLQVAIGGAVGIFQAFVRVVNLGNRAAAGFWEFLGNEKRAADARAQAAAIDAATDAMTKWKDAAIAAGSDRVARGLDTFATRAFSSDQFRNAPAQTDASGLQVETVVSRNAVAGPGEGTEPGKEGEDKFARAARALEAFNVAGERNRILTALLGEDFDALGSEASRLEGIMSALAAEGFDESNDLMQSFAEQLANVREEQEKLADATKLEEEAMHAQAFAAGELASALGAAMAGGLGPFAKSKAKQNLLEASELAIRAVVAGLTGFGAAKAGAFASAAAKHLGLAAAWGALGASAGGGGGAGGTAIASPSGGGGGSVTPTSARTSNSSRAARTEPMGADVQIHFVGPGFDALNPEVQRIVRGAVQEGSDRFGNARVRVVRRNA